ncbi:MAG: hypothetical protein HPZ91_18520 [Lentisphaeria bacterium]|nr:hypothetical protein [Lentisphaeria bacterium]
MALIKVECPHCRRHYAIDEDERGEVFECISCRQPFNGSDAAVLGFMSRNGAVYALLALSLVMFALNIVLWTRLQSPAPEAVVNAVEIVPPVAPAELSALADRVAALEKALTEVREKAAEAKPAKPAESNADVIRSIFIRLGKLESDIAQLKEK